MKFTSIIGSAAAIALLAIMTIPLSAQANAGDASTKCVAIQAQVDLGDSASPMGSRGNGESCSKDCQCSSKECKGFQCVTRDLSKHPVVSNGGACVFDGDCASCDCVRGVCK